MSFLYSYAEWLCNLVWICAVCNKPIQDVTQLMKYRQWQKNKKYNIKKDRLNDYVHVQPWRQIWDLTMRLCTLMSMYICTCMYIETCVVLVCAHNHSQLSVTIHNSLWCGHGGWGQGWRRAGSTGEEVVLFQFEMLWELQLDLGLLNVIVDGRNEGFC